MANLSYTAGENEINASDSVNIDTNFERQENSLNINKILGTVVDSPHATNVMKNNFKSQIC